MRGPDDFRGDWSVTRQITDHASGQDAKFEGSASLTGTGDALSYSERGDLVLAGGQRMHAERRYRWTFGVEGVDVVFEDGAPFHRFLPWAQSDGTPHLCGADLYQCSYDFRDWPQWTAVWVVKGPRKDYTSRTTYRRQG